MYFFAAFMIVFILIVVNLVCINLNQPSMMGHAKKRPEPTTMAVADLLAIGHGHRVVQVVATLVAVSGLQKHTSRCAGGYGAVVAMLLLAAVVAAAAGVVATAAIAVAAVVVTVAGVVVAAAVRATVVGVVASQDFSNDGGNGSPTARGGGVSFAAGGGGGGDAACTTAGDGILNIT
jgi:hypothetical protein